MAKILLIEDDLLIQELVALFLEDQEHQVITATHAREGISLAQTENPDLILMDLRLPEIDGWTATKLLKTSPKTEEIPVLAITAQSIKAVMTKFETVTFDGYVQKPINFNALFGQIEAFTGGQTSNNKITA